MPATLTCISDPRRYIQGSTLLIHLNRHYAAIMNICISNDGEKIHSYVPYPIKLKQILLKCGEF